MLKNWDSSEYSQKRCSRLPSQRKEKKKVFGNSLFFGWKISTFLTIMEAAKVLQVDNIISNRVFLWPDWSLTIYPMLDECGYT
jgi:hypothetical protein